MRRARDGRELQALLPIPSQIDRFVRLPATDGSARFLPLEELLLLNVGALFPGYELAGSCAFRILRDSDLEVEEEAEDLVREFEVALKRRRRGEVVRLTDQRGRARGPEGGDHRTAGVAGDEIVDVEGHDRAGEPEGTGARRPARPFVEILHPARAGTGAGP
jgi:polyphosphate kinase